MNLRAIAAGGALLALGFAAGAWWMDARRAAEVAELERAAARSMVADLAALSGAVPGPALPPVASAPAAAPPPAAAAPVASDASPSAAARNAKPLPPEIAELVGRLMSQDRDHEAQKRDEAWASLEERRIHEVLASNRAMLPAGAAIGEVDCRTTTCRVSVVHVPDGGATGMPTEVKDLTTLFGSLDYGVSMTSAGASAPGTSDWHLFLRPGISKSAEPGAQR